jgi:FkbM family methyltransferase
MGNSRAKRFVLTTIYPLIELFPKKWSCKFKMIGNILLHDWSMDGFSFFNANERMNHATARQFFAELDEESLAAIDWLYRVSALYVPKELLSFYFYNRSWMPAITRAKLRAARKCQRLFHRRYGLRNVGWESCYYHHGLKELRKSIIESIRGKDFLDIGACHGESSLAFMTYAPRKVIAFEPSAKNRAIYTRNLTRSASHGYHYCLDPIALGDTCGIARFHDCGNGAAALTDPGEDSCDVLPLDSYTAGKGLQIGFFKGDVEGMGLALIKGALQTLRRDRPVISLAVYHCASEVFDVFSLLKQELPGYTFQFRLLNDEVPMRELTLIAFPNEFVNKDANANPPLNNKQEI